MVTVLAYIFHVEWTPSLPPPPTLPPTPCGAAAQCRPGPPHSWGFEITQSVGLLWTSDQLITEELHLWLKLLVVCSVNWNTFCKILIIISFKFNKKVDRTLEIKEMVSKHPHRLQIHNVKIIVFFAYIIYNLYTLTAMFSTSKENVYKQHEFHWPLRHTYHTGLWGKLTNFNSSFFLHHKHPWAQQIFGLSWTWTSTNH